MRGEACAAVHVTTCLALAPGYVFLGLFFSSPGSLGRCHPKAPLPLAAVGRGWKVSPPDGLVDSQAVVPLLRPSASTCRPAGQLTQRVVARCPDGAVSG